ncbi:MAG: cytochrome c3 family protein [Desulfobacterales bacterium]|nr:MAG: cytochrome c3 family protein [Desulfobacterales bacterium]
MRKLVIGIMCLAAFWVFRSSVVISRAEADEEMCVPMGTIVIEPPESVEAKRAPVDFPHSIHFGFSCQTCHHKWETDAAIVGCKTSGCHDVAVAPTKSEKSEADKTAAARYYKSAYHQKCIGCHKEIKKKNQELELSQEALPETLPPSGPTGCIQCHPKE